VLLKSCKYLRNNLFVNISNYYDIIIIRYGRQPQWRTVKIQVIMPTNELKCNSFKERFGIFISVSGREKVKYPKCNSANLSQILSGSYVIGTEHGKGSCSCNTSSFPSCSTRGIKKEKRRNDG